MGLENPLHIAILLLIVLLVFGAKRLPEMGRSLGSGIRGFKETISGESSEPQQLNQQAAPAAQTETRPTEPAARTADPAARTADPAARAADPAARAAEPAAHTAEPNDRPEVHSAA